MTEAHRRAVKAHADARKARGDRKVTFWVSAAQGKKLDRLAEIHGSQQAAIDAAIEEAKAPWKREG